MSAGRGVLQRPNYASIDRHSWPGLDFSASILACQKHSRFRRRRARYSWCLEYDVVEVSGVFRQRDDLSNRLTLRLDCGHSLSNHGSDGRRTNGDSLCWYKSVKNWYELTVIQFSKLISIEIGPVVTLTRAVIQRVPFAVHRCWADATVDERQT